MIELFETKTIRELAEETDKGKVLINNMGKEV